MIRGNKDKCGACGEVKPSKKCCFINMADNSEHEDLYYYCNDCFNNYINPLYTIKIYDFHICKGAVCDCNPREAVSF